MTIMTMLCYDEDIHLVALRWVGWNWLQMEETMD